MAEDSVRPNRQSGEKAFEFGCVGFKGKPGLKVIPSLVAFASMRALGSLGRDLPRSSKKKLGVGKI